jgi:solute carrier family 25 2-oxodicarboxylate transporter 21
MSTATTTHPHNRKQSPLPPGAKFLVGAIGGTVEISLQMPLLTYKFCVQEGRALPTNWKGWYRGLGTQITAVAPLTAIQFWANGLLQRMVLHQKQQQQHNNGSRTAVETVELTKSEIIGCAAGAGIVSASISSPNDMLTIQQQRLKLQSPVETARYIINRYGITRGWFRGYGASAIRGSVYTAGYLGVGPLLSTYYHNSQTAYYGGTGDSSGSGAPSLFAKILGACTAGSISAFLTHPLDTAKTRVQADMSRQKYPTALRALLTVYRANGLHSLYRGLAPRMVRNCGAYLICMTIRDLAEQHRGSIMVSYYEEDKDTQAIGGKASFKSLGQQGPALR